MTDLAAVWDAHVEAEFATRDADATVATVPTDPFVDVVVQVHFEVVPKNRSIFRGAWDRPVG